MQGHAGSQALKVLPESQGFKGPRDWRETRERWEKRGRSVIQVTSGMLAPKVKRVRWAPLDFQGSLDLRGFWEKGERGGREERRAMPASWVKLD